MKHFTQSLIHQQEILLALLSPKYAIYLSEWEIRFLVSVLLKTSESIRKGCNSASIHAHLCYSRKIREKIQQIYSSCKDQRNEYFRRRYHNGSVSMPEKPIARPSVKVADVGEPNLVDWLAMLGAM